MTILSVRILVWCDNLCFLPFLHGDESLVPRLDDLANTDLTLEWSSLLDRGVENTSIFECSMIVSRDESTIGTDFSLALLSRDYLKLG